MQKTENIQVAIRFRPYNKKEEGKDPDSYSLKIDQKSNTVTVLDGKESSTFSFDHVFAQNSTQTDVYSRLAQNTVEWVCQGYNATIFAYGNTSSGKTYTMFGGQGESMGIIPRSCSSMFEIINRSENVVEASLKCSFIEIYCERIRDLLCPTQPVELKIRNDLHSKGVYVQGLVEKHVYNPQDILDTISEGASIRSTSSTALNGSSSRSHAVLTLILSQKLSDGSETISKLHMIDLAGSENVGKSEAQGTVLIEAQNINKSLSCLGNVISALTEKGRDHIPYRDSKLTYLLQDSLGGNSKTIIIATASPSHTSYTETLNTMKFTKKAKEIRNIPKINKNESVANLLTVIEELKGRIKELEGSCEDSRIIIQAVEDAHPDSKETALLRTRCERLEKKIQELEAEKINETIRNKQVRSIFNKQRELAKKAARELFRERLKNRTFHAEMEELRNFYRSSKEVCENSELLQMIAKRAIVPMTDISIVEPTIPDDTEIELYSP
jgi:kinesin family protein 5